MDTTIKEEGATAAESQELQQGQPDQPQGSTQRQAAEATPAYKEEERPYIIARGLGLNAVLGHPYMNVNLQIPHGCLAVINGEHGTGKTPLLLTLAGRMFFNKGTLEVGGYRLPKDRNRLMKVSGMGLFDNLNDLEENLSVRTVTRAELELYGRPHRKSDALEYLKRWGLDQIESERIANLSRKELVWLGIALGMVKNPELLVVDDVESDLTIEESREMMSLLKNIAHKRNIVVVVGVTDPLIVDDADYIYHIKAGD